MRKIALIGRPNVGKSALFNRIAKKRIAIIDPEEGCTRDRLYASAELFGTPFQIVDTGGLDNGLKTPFHSEVRASTLAAIEEADSLVLVVDGKMSPTTLDYDVAQLALTSKKPVALAVNKIDSEDSLFEFNSYYSLGIKECFPVSAFHDRNIAELLEAVLIDAPEESIEPEKQMPNLAVVGRPNVGKSSLVNTFLDEERCIVSPTPGSTRDSVDLEIDYQGSPLRLIDTAGIRKKKSEKNTIEKFAAIRTSEAIERSDVCLFLIEANQGGLTAHDKRIAQMIDQAGKSCVVLINKWDLVKGFRMEHCLKAIHDDVAFLRHCPKIVISVKQGRNLDEIFPKVLEVYQERQKRISTSELNRFIEQAMTKTPPPMVQGKRLKVFYMTQVEVAPPRCVMIVNTPRIVTKTYQRYLYNQFRKAFGFTGTPVNLMIKRKKQTANSE